MEIEFPDCSGLIYGPHTRKIGLSTNEIDPLHVLQMIKDYNHTLPKESNKYEFYKDWFPAMEHFLKKLSKYPMDNVGKLLIIHNKLVIHEFYLIFDIHIDDVKTVHVNLDTYVAPYSFISSVIQTFALLSGVGTFGVFFSRLFL